MKGYCDCLRETTQTCLQLLYEVIPLLQWPLILYYLVITLMIFILQLACLHRITFFLFNTIEIESLRTINNFIFTRITKYINTTESIK